MQGQGRLARRLNRATILAWLIAMALLGAVFGKVAISITDLLAGESADRRIASVR